MNEKISKILKNAYLLNLLIFTSIFIVGIEINQNIIKYAAILLNAILWFIAIIQFKHVINDLVEENERWKKEATYDNLTGVINRGIFTKQMRDEIERSNRYEKNFSFIMLDIDNFKTINDNYGHQKGDEVLKSLGKILLRAVRTMDRVGRLGGEEFGVFLPETDIDGAISIAERIQNEIKNININGNVVTISAGISSKTKEMETADSMYKKADEALYRSKNEGKNTIRYFH